MENVLFLASLSFSVLVLQRARVLRRDGGTLQLRDLHQLPAAQPHPGWGGEVRQALWPGLSARGRVCVCNKFCGNTIMWRVDPGVLGGATGTAGTTAAPRTATAAPGRSTAAARAVSTSGAAPRWLCRWCRAGSGLTAGIVSHCNSSQGMLCMKISGCLPGCRCGLEFPLGDGEPSECEGGSENPCCSRYSRAAAPY